MKKINSTLILLLFTLFSGQIFAQASAQILLRNGEMTFAPNLQEYIENANTSKHTTHYKLMIFNSVPTDNVKESLKSKGVVFLEYVPNNAFIVKFTPQANYDFLNQKNISGIYDLPSTLKLDYRLHDWNIPQHAIATNDKVKVAVIAMKGVNITKLY